MAGTRNTYNARFGRSGHLWQTDFSAGGPPYRRVLAKGGEHMLLNFDSQAITALEIGAHPR
jgi:hypothetical protein